MAAVLKAAKEQLICHLCKQVLVEPKTLNCMHSFCKKCIQQYMENTTKGQKNPAGFLCPDCKHVMPLSHLKGQSAEDWAKELQTNEALFSILKAFKNSGEEIAMKCAFHAEKEVEFYCEDHDMLLCSLCATLTHKPCADVNTIAVAAARRKAEGGKFINFLSEQITMSEKILSDRKEQMTALDKSEKEIKNQLSQMKKRMTDYLDAMENKMVQELTQRKIKEMHALKSDVDICNGILNEATTSLKTIEQSIEKDPAPFFVVRFKEQAQLLDERQGRLLRYIQTLKTIKLSFQPNRGLEQSVVQGKSIGGLNTDHAPSRLAQVYVKSAPVEQQKPRPGTGRTRPYSGVSSTAPTPRSVRSTTDMHSFRKPTIPRQIRSREFTRHEPDNRSLISQNSARISESKLPNDLTQSKAMEDTSVDGKTATAKLKTEFIASVPDQKECSIEGAAILKSGHVVLSDSYHSSLKLFDPKYVYVGLIKFATSPNDVCAVGDNEVVVCLPDTMRVKHEKIENNKIVPGEVLTVGDKCHAVGYNNGTLACCSRRTIHVFTREKNSWLRVSTTPMEADNLQYIAVDPNGERIVVSRNGYPNSSLVCLTKGKDGRSLEKIWSYTHEELRLPRGIAFLGESILIVSWDQQKVIQLSRKGELEGVVIHQGVQWPWKLCISPKNDRLLLTQCYYRLPFKDKNCVKVFKITR